MESEERTALQYYRSVDHAVEVFTNYFGPTLLAARPLDEDARQQLREDVREVFERYNRATDGTAVVENRYRLTVAAVACRLAGLTAPARKRNNGCHAGARVDDRP
jgi:hypothetical protein